jgi:hypothetical protein
MSVYRAIFFGLNLALATCALSACGPFANTPLFDERLRPVDGQGEGKTLGTMAANLVVSVKKHHDEIAPDMRAADIVELRQEPSFCELPGKMVKSSLKRGVSDVLSHLPAPFLAQIAVDENVAKRFIGDGTAAHLVNRPYIEFSADTSPATREQGEALFWFVSEVCEVGITAKIMTKAKALSEK